MAMAASKKMRDGFKPITRNIAMVAKKLGSKK
jgi:hypothetical protein